MERLSLEKLQVLLIDTFNYDYKKRALLGPMIHEFDDEYYDAAILYITENQKTVLKSLFVSIEDIQKEMGCDYLEALCILNNIKKHPDQVDFIMHYSKVE